MVFLLKKINVLWEFARPHTIVGTTLSVISLYFIIEHRWIPIHWQPLWWALISTWAGNIYIVGLNQIYDVEIDRINKPYLPIPSGELSIASAWKIVGISLILALLVSSLINKYLFLIIVISVLIGTFYSVPPIRLKKFPLLASLSILTVRGMVVNLGLSVYYSEEILNRPFITPEIWILTIFMILFSLDIAWFKDMPDKAGDIRFGIRTFTVQLGVRAVFRMGLAVLFFSYLLILVIPLITETSLDLYFFIPIHLFMLGFIFFQARRVDISQNVEIIRFYKFIWKIFYLEYIVFALAVLLS